MKLETTALRSGLQWGHGQFRTQKRGSVIERAGSEGPQTITHHGKERAVVLSIEDYRRLMAHRPDFKAYLLGDPKVDDFSIDRDRDAGRPSSFDPWRQAIGRSFPVIDMLIAASAISRGLATIAMMADCD